MGKQVKVNLTIDEEVVKAAKQLGLNMSKISENALKEYIKRLTKSETMTNGGKPSLSLSEGSLFGKRESSKPRAGFEPATSALPRR